MMETAQIITSVGTAIVAGFAGWQIHVSSKNAALTWLYLYMQERREREALMQTAIASGEKDKVSDEFVELLNFIQITILSCEKALIPSHIRPFVVRDMQQVIANIERHDEVNLLFGQQLENRDILDTVRDFRRTHRTVIDRIKRSADRREH